MKVDSREIERIKRMVIRMENMRVRLAIPHPDLCFFLANYVSFGWKHLKKIGAKKGHLVLSFGWLRATIAW